MINLTQRYHLKLKKTTGQWQVRRWVKDTVWLNFIISSLFGLSEYEVNIWHRQLIPYLEHDKPLQTKQSANRNIRESSDSWYNYKSNKRKVI